MRIRPRQCEKEKAQGREKGETGMTEIDTDKLVERLRNYHKVASACGNLTDRPQNLARMSGEAADAIIAMAEERDRMREALERIAEQDKVRSWTATEDNPETHWEITDGIYAIIARRALGKEQS